MAIISRREFEGENQDISMVERQARDLEVRVRILVQVQIFLLKFMKFKSIEVNTNLYFVPWEITILDFKKKLVM